MQLLQILIFFNFSSAGSGKGRGSSLSAGTVCPRPPAVGSQVTIQSELEKQLRKIHRKEEKKVARQMKGLESVGVTDHATQLQLLGFDPAELKKER